MTTASSEDSPPTPVHGDGIAPSADGFGDVRVDRWLRALVGIAVIAGVVLRFWPRSDLWLDEALSLNIARLPIGEIPEALRHDGHPPLYYALLHVWTSVSTSAWWVRSLSGVVALAGFPLAYAAGRRVGRRTTQDHLGSSRTALIALAVYAIVPYGVRYGAETRMYALVIVEVLAGYLLVERLWTGELAGPARRWASGGLALVTGALLWTHYWSIWLVACVGATAVWTALRSPSTDRRTGARWSVAAIAVGGLIFVHWLPAMLYQSAHTGTPWGARFRPTTMLLVTITDFAGGSFAEAQLLSYLLVGLVAAALVVRLQSSSPPALVLGGRPLPRVRVEVGLLLSTLAVAWAVSFAAGGTFASRYAAVVYPLFLIAVAAGIALARSPRATTLLVAVVVLGSTMAGAIEVSTDRSQSGVVASRILADEAQRPNAESVVVVCPDQLGPALGRALERRSPSGWPKIVPFPSAGNAALVDWVDYEERNRRADPAAFVDALSARTPADATVYLAVNNTYKTFEGKCEGIAAALARGRAPALLVAGDGDNFYEGFSLFAFRPRP
ncbi:MAG: hypothetical protein ACKOYM_10945 [Actinomycetes bacterium]